MTKTPLWTPGDARVAQSNMVRFIGFANARGETLNGFDELHAFSVAHPERFWGLYWDFAGIKAAARGEDVLVDGDKMPGARFFPQASLNYAENLLAKNDDSVAMVFHGEDKVRTSWTWRQVNAQVSKLQQGLSALGLEAGDRVCAVVPNMPETIMMFAAVASLGGVWSSCSPDFGRRGILDRFGQIEPRVLVVCDGYFYSGKTFDIGDKIKAVLEDLPSVEKIVVIDYIGRAAETAKTLDNASAMVDFAAPYAAQDILYEQLPFDHPLYILFSSGTTGVPKCIVHRAGGILLKHLSEQQLHVDLKPQDRAVLLHDLRLDDVELADNRASERCNVAAV